MLNTGTPRKGVGISLNPAAELASTSLGCSSASTKGLHRRFTERSGFDGWNWRKDIFAFELPSVS
jgi:hypothetical protein